MLEVFAIIGLCKVNKRNAIANGRRPGGYIALTIVLWIVMEFIGAIVGTVVAAVSRGGDISDESGIKLVAILFAYGFAGIGALISFLCAKFAPKGNYVDPSLQATPQYGQSPIYGNSSTPAYMSSNQPAQPQEFVHVENPYQPAPVQQSVQYCEFCGQTLKPGSRYCASCGSKVEVPVGE